MPRTMVARRTCSSPSWRDNSTEYLCRNLPIQRSIQSLYDSVLDQVAGIDIHAIGLRRSNLFASDIPGTLELRPDYPCKLGCVTTRRDHALKASKVKLASRKGEQ